MDDAATGRSIDASRRSGLSHNSFIALKIGFVALFLLVSGHYLQADGQTDRQLKKENKIFLKEFGFQLPASSVVTQKLVTQESKVTFLFIKMPVDDLKSFRFSFFTQVTNTRTRVVHPGDLIGWLPGYNLDDEPTEYESNWTRSNNLSLGILARILILVDSDRGKDSERTRNVSNAKFAVLQTDMDKGFMQIRYKR